MNDDCLFCRIVQGDERAHLVYEDDRVVAFLDIRPLFHGHTLVVPREHHRTIGDLPDELLPHFFYVVRALSVSVRDATASVGSFVAMNNVVSQSVPHLHCHVVPRNPKDGLRGFFWPRSRYDSDAEMAEVAERIRAEVEEVTA